MDLLYELIQAQLVTYLDGVYTQVYQGFPDSSVGNPPVMQETPVRFLSREEGIGYPLKYSGFPCGSAGKESARNAVPGLERSPGEGKGYPLQYYGLENFMDYIVYGAAKSMGSQRPDTGERLSPSHTQVNKHISLLCQLRQRLKSNDSPIAKTTPTIQILVSNTIS